MFAYRWLYFNFKTVFESFQVYIIAYALISFCVSLAFVYYNGMYYFFLINWNMILMIDNILGPISNPRTFKILEFLLSAIAVVSLYFTIQVRAVFVTLVITYVLVKSGCILCSGIPSLSCFSYFKKLR